MFDRVLNKLLEYARIHAKISLWQWYGLKAFTEDWINARVWKSWFIAGLFKEVLPLFFFFFLHSYIIFYKFLRSVFIFLAYNFQSQGAERLNFVSVKASFSLLPRTNVRLLLPPRHPLCDRACIDFPKKDFTKFKC